MARVRGCYCGTPRLRLTEPAARRANHRRDIPDARSRIPIYSGIGLAAPCPVQSLPLVSYPRPRYGEAALSGLGERRGAWQSSRRAGRGGEPAAASGSVSCRARELPAGRPCRVQVAELLCMHSGQSYR
eukprot:scaffold926_cov408-Prasinococcus_capsulatus_cf.AAC.16